jgi:hypothetical protein
MEIESDRYDCSQEKWNPIAAAVLLSTSLPAGPCTLLIIIRQLFELLFSKANCLAYQSTAYERLS